MEGVLNVTKADELLVRAARCVDEAAAGNYHRDVIRTEPFTDKAKSFCQTAVKNDA